LRISDTESIFVFIHFPALNMSTIKERPSIMQDLMLHKRLK